MSRSQGRAATPLAFDNNARPTTAGSTASDLSLKTKTARFAEATAVNSPLDPVGPAQFSFPAQAVSYQRPQMAPVETHFGASVDHKMSSPDSGKDELPSAVDSYDSGPPSPPVKTPFTAMPFLSPTWKEEESLEKAQGHTDKEQVKDLKVKTRVRIAKLMLRGVNFSCSLIVLSMLSTSLTIFRATRDLPPRYVGNKQLMPWAPNQKTWPQFVVLAIACASLLITTVVLYMHCRHGYRRARKSNNYYNLFAIATWIFSIIMWILGATVLQHTRLVGKGQDFWGWSCAQNTRSQVFSDDIKYSLVCRLQNWSLVCCIIEVVVEAITISIYSIMAYRFWSKRRLTKSMSNRNNARSELYTAQLRHVASAPQTPAWPTDSKGDAVEMQPSTTQYAESPSNGNSQLRPFILQPAPVSRVASPGMHPGFTPTPVRAYSPPGAAVDEQNLPMSPREVRRDHIAARPGERVYDSVPIPGAY
ncbi:hypothetical protein ANO11243_072920 [Dothideomycetidae sp. 11243]|nr:hypothetical protein ANO11243_072920 [fungal sp. No.11243]